MNAAHYHSIKKQLALPVLFKALREDLYADTVKWWYNVARNT